MCRRSGRGSAPASRPRAASIRASGRPGAHAARAAAPWSALPEQLPQHELQDSTVAVVKPLIRCVNAHTGLELGVVGLDLQRARAVLELFEIEGLLAGQAERLRGLPIRELQRQDAHADEVRAVD